MPPPKQMARTIIFMASLTLNGLFLLLLLLQRMSAPTERLGVLTRDVNAGGFGSNEISFKLPKGLTVMDVSPQGLNAIGMFEPNRYAVVITTDEQSLVNYKPEKLRQFGELYSIDNRKPEGNKASSK